MRRSLLPVALVVPLLLAGCGEQKVASYRVPKEKETAPAAETAAPAQPPATAAPMTAASAPAAAAGNAMASTPVATANGEPLTWTAPAHWQAKPASAMRKGTYAIVGEGGAAELAITSFGGDVGGEIANINRWRSQVQLPPLSDADATKSVVRLEQAGLKIGVVEMNSASTRLLGAMVPYAGATWFFKLTGPDALVAKEKPAFMEFLKTLKPAK